ncbi:oligosaccharide flippase family protein [Thalassotalea fonticola]|uniref:Oligosaccharide flippase family protein n=1 Tax=Thalassotalea fonticola TaxID=3065649 RepID=A0ABZ0GM77_9GAMM|nr:oligosaccharide flippase family protein [Colwelliaceae bacterium S1-1]
MKNLSTERRLITSSVFRFVEKAVIVISSLLLTPFLINTLGQSQYGLWILILSILGWFRVIQLGFPSAVQRYITLYLEQQKFNAVNQVFSTSLVLFSILGLIAASLLILLSQTPEVLGAQSSHQVTLSLAFLIFSLKVFWDLCMTSINAFFSGLIRFDVDANLSSLNVIIKSVLIYLLITDLNISGAIIAVMVADITSNLAKIYYVKRLYPRLEFKFSLVSLAELKKLFSFAKHIIAVGFTKAINTRIDPFIISKIFDLNAVAFYSVADRLASHVEQFSLTVSGVFQPVFTKMVASKENMEGLFLQVSFLNLFIASALYCPLLIFGESFLTLWIGSEFSQAIVLINILVFALICSAFSISITHVLIAQANHKLVAPLYFVAALINLGLSILLAQYFGLKGVAIGTAIGSFLANVVFCLLMLKRYNHFDLRALIQRFLFCILMLFVIGLSGQYMVKTYLQLTWISLSLSVLVCLPLTTWIFWLIILPSAMKKQIIKYLKQNIKTSVGLKFSLFFKSKDLR